MNQSQTCDPNATVPSEASGSLPLAWNGESNNLVRYPMPLHTWLCRRSRSYFAVERQPEPVLSSSKIRSEIRPPPLDKFQNRHLWCSHWTNSREILQTMECSVTLGRRRSSCRRRAGQPAVHRRCRSRFQIHFRCLSCCPSTTGCRASPQTVACARCRKEEAETLAQAQLELAREKVAPCQT